MFQALSFYDADLPPRNVLKLVAGSFATQLCQALRDKDVRAFRAAGVAEDHARKFLQCFRTPSKVNELAARATLHSWGLSDAAVKGAIEAHGDKAPRLLRSDPRSLLAFGASLELADKLARRFGSDCAARLAIVAEDRLREAARDGHTAIPVAHVLDRAAALSIAIDPGEAEDVLRRDFAVVGGGVDAFVCKRDVYEAEVLVATGFRERSRESYLDPRAFDGIAGTPEQLAAAKMVCTAAISIITGGPGVGKTHLIGEMVGALGRDKCLLTAPTGRCARNLSGRTVHSHTARAGARVETAYRRPIQEIDAIPDTVELIVCDEASMKDAKLMAALLRLAPRRAHIVLVGDVDQLPPVAPGAVLRDAIEARACPVAYLTTNHRSEAAITECARALLRGELPDFATPHVTLAPKWRMTARVVELACSGAQPLVPTNKLRVRLNRAIQAADETELPVTTTRTVRGVPKGACASLVTSKKGEAFLDVDGKRVEVDLDEALNAVATRPHGRLKCELGVCIAPRSPVVVLRNQANNAACNGDVGTLVSFTKTGATVELQRGDVVDVKFKDAEKNLTLAHVLTVHKSQGGEFESVVVPIEDPWAWNTSLLYTAITRAKTSVVILGTRADLMHIVRKPIPRRMTALSLLFDM